MVRPAGRTHLPALLAIALLVGVITVSYLAGTGDYEAGLAELVGATESGGRTGVTAATGEADYDDDGGGGGDAHAYETACRLELRRSSIDRQLVAELCARQYLFVSGYHGSGTTYITNLLSMPTSTDGGLGTAHPLYAAQVRGFATEHCFRHVARGWGGQSDSPPSCTGAPEDEGEMLQNVWPRFVDRVNDLSRHCPSCDPANVAPVRAESSNTTAESCAYYCPDLAQLALGSSDVARERWRTFWERSSAAGSCNCCQADGAGRGGRGSGGGSGGGNEQLRNGYSAAACEELEFNARFGGTTPSACRCQNGATLGDRPTIGDVLFRELSYFWGDSRGIELLVEKTPDLAPWLKLALFPRVSTSVVVLRHPYYQARCEVGTQSVPRKIQICVRQWEEGIEYALARLREAERAQDQRWAAVR